MLIGGVGSDEVAVGAGVAVLATAPEPHEVNKMATINK
jgi:hypothetical protein